MPPSDPELRWRQQVSAWEILRQRYDVPIRLISLAAGMDVATIKNALQQIQESANAPLSSEPINWEAIRELYDLGYSDRKIAEQCRIKRDAVRDWRKRNGLRPNRSKYSPIAIDTRPDCDDED